MNYHIGRLVHSSLCVGAFVAAGIWLVFVLQAEALLQPRVIQTYLIFSHMLLLSRIRIIRSENKSQ